MEDPNVTREMNAGDVPVRPLHPATRPATPDTTQAIPVNAPQPPQPAPPTEPADSGAIDADTLLSDAERRKKLEQELSRLGMTPDEVRRLLNADSYSTDPLKQSTGWPPISPAAQAPSEMTGKGGAGRTSAESLHSFAAQLMSAQASAQIKAVEHVSLGLPEFRESSAQEVRQAEQLLRDAAMLRRREKYNEAEVKCREALTLVPKDAAALELLGDLLQGVARIDEALAAYKRAVEADPRRSSAERKYGELLVQQQRWGGPDPEAVPKNRFFATLLSALLPGLGQFHNGETLKGVFFLLVDAVCFYLLALSPYGFAGEHHRHGLNTSLLACLVITVVVYLAAVMDANAVARQGGRQRGGSSGWDV